MSQLAFTVTGDIVRELAATQQVCGRPVLRRVKDRHTGAEEVVPIRCGSTRESVCAACARKALIIRMQQCAEGWHLTDEPERTPAKQLDDQDDDDQDDDETASKRVRSTRRRQDVPDLPRVEFDPRTVGQVLFVAPLGPRAPAFDVPHPHTAFLRRRARQRGTTKPGALQLPASRPGRAPLLQAVRKTVAHHKADRAEVVRETLLSAGIDAPDLDRMAASVTLPDGSPRFVWTDVRPDHDTYVKIILDSISERQRWRIQYEHAKTAGPGAPCAAGRLDGAQDEVRGAVRSHGSLSLNRALRGPAISKSNSSRHQAVNRPCEVPKSCSAPTFIERLAAAI